MPAETVPITSDAANRLLERLVAIPSPSGNESSASAFLVEWMADNGFRAEVDEVGNAVGVKGEGEREILLLGHIDTFPGQLPVRREGDLLHGRGSVDAKGPLATFAAAAAGVVVPEAWRVTVVGAVEEESWTSRGARHVVDRRRDRPPLYCIIGEPSRWDRITLGYKGCLELFLTLRSAYAHSAGPERLPAERTVDLWRAVEAFCEMRNHDRAPGEFERLTPTLRAISSEDDGAFGVGRLGVSFRLALRDRLEDLRRDLEASLERTVGSWSGNPQLDIRFRGGEPAHRGAKNTPLVRAMLRAIRAMDAEPRFVVKTGTSDMNIVGPAWPEMPIIAYGPGDSSLDHTPSEHLSLTEYHGAIAVLTEVLGTLTA